jgi:hypothetical protein
MIFHGLLVVETVAVAVFAALGGLPNGREAQ